MPKIPSYLLNRKAPRIPFTKGGYETLVAEKKKLEHERPDAVEHLRKAREMGDLSENGYYKAARQRLSFIDARLRRFADIIKRATIIQSSKTGVVDIGSTVEVQSSNKKTMFMIVGGYESNPAQQTISHLSPLGRALMGKQVGDTVSVAAPAGSMQYRILRLI